RPGEDQDRRTASHRLHLAEQVHAGARAEVVVEQERVPVPIAARDLRDSVLVAARPRELVSVSDLPEEIAGDDELVLVVVDEQHADGSVFSHAWLPAGVTRRAGTSTASSCSPAGPGTRIRPALRRTSSLPGRTSSGCPPPRARWSGSPPGSSGAADRS